MVSSSSFLLWAPAPPTPPRSMHRASLTATRLLLLILSALAGHGLQVPPPSSPPRPLKQHASLLFLLRHGSQLSPHETLLRSFEKRISSQSLPQVQLHYSEARSRHCHFKSFLGKQVWWLMFVISARKETEEGGRGPEFKTRLDRKEDSRDKTNDTAP